MALKEFKDYPNTETPINSGNLNFNFKEVMNLIYPIGSIMIQANNTDYSDFLGFTWERTLIGKVAVGIDEDDTDFNEIGKTGGEKEHTLTVAELAEHDHETEGHYSYYGEGPSTATLLAWGSGTALVQKAGGGQAHNNLQPYQVVAFWKRVA